MTFISTNDFKVGDIVRGPHHSSQRSYKNGLGKITGISALHDSIYVKWFILSTPISYKASELDIAWWRE